MTYATGNQITREDTLSFSRQAPYYQFAPRQWDRALRLHNRITTLSDDFLNAEESDDLDEAHTKLALVWTLLGRDNYKRDVAKALKSVEVILEKFPC